MLPAALLLFALLMLAPTADVIRQGRHHTRRT